MVLVVLEQPLSKKEQQELDEEQKKKIVEKEHEFKQIKETSLKQHFKNSNNLPSRNSAILKALYYGSGVEYTPKLCYTTKNKKVTQCQEDQE